ncbi:MAG: helix-turn-helix transcriptional regulator [Sporolactobacillus sp.]
MLVPDLMKMRRLRKERMTLLQMAEKLGYRSQNGYYYLESGIHKISAEMLAQVAAILEVPIQDLFIERGQASDDRQLK